MKVLFVLKKNGYTHGGKNSYNSSGLFNSSKFVVDMLEHHGIAAKLVTVVDNNEIDKEVSEFNPNVVIIEALWVVPEKFDVLKNLHPSVKWVVRLHSDVPFLATEGIAVDWVLSYVKRGVYVAFNATNAKESFKGIEDSSKYIYLPNYYPEIRYRRPQKSNTLRIGCFGAVRPLKNQLEQAVAAVNYANATNKELHFYMNSRVEQGGQEVLKNIQHLFASTRHTLKETPWLERRAFLHLMSKMNLAMCMSFTETFCLTAADAVTVGTPLLCSSQIPWASFLSTYPETSTRTIEKGISRLLGPLGIVSAVINSIKLAYYSRRSAKIWLKFFTQPARVAPKQWWGAPQCVPQNLCGGMNDESRRLCQRVGQKREKERPRKV